MKKLSEITYQVMWNRLISVVEEQAQALIRTAFSTSVREAGDLSAGVYNLQGDMLAQAVTGTPGHVNAMADSVAHFMREIGVETMKDGDAYITNDPWQGTGHKHDITIVTPVFYQNAQIGYFACTAHITDIGGRGFGPDGSDIYEEGLHIPILRFLRAGLPDQTLIEIIRSNVRAPDQLIGDIHALVTCNEIGKARLLAMLKEYKIAGLEDLSQFILSRSRAATLAKINALSEGSASGAMRIDGYETPIDLCVTLRIEKDRILADYAGTSPIDLNGINVPLVYTKAYTCYALKCAIAPDIPNNAASLAPFEITAPENAIVNAVSPAPVASRHVIGHMIPDVVYDALDQLLPETVPAEGSSSLCIFQISTRPNLNSQDSKQQRAEVLTFNSGGSGARPLADGLNATAFPSGVMTMPVEATEKVGPVIIWRKELRAGSGGAGRFRGGLGQYMSVGARSGHDFDINTQFDRLKYPARGRHGGKNGAATKLRRSDGVPMKGKGKQSIPSGLVVEMAFAGGAGYGAPQERPREDVFQDLVEGYISISEAREDYGLTEEEISHFQAQEGVTLSEAP